VAESERWLWLGGSLLLAVIATQVAWWLWRREKSRTTLERAVRSPFFAPLYQLVWLLYTVGLPIAALIAGHDAVVARLLGLQPLVGLDPAASWNDWARDVGWAVALGAAAWAVLVAGWRATWRSGRLGRPEGAQTPAWALLLAAVGHETHWAFYRNAPVVVLGPYWGTWAGLGLIALEAALNPWWRSDLRERERAPQALLRAGLAVLSAAIYLQTTNLWLAVLVHWLITWGLAAWARALAERAPLTRPEVP